MKSKIDYFLSLLRESSEYKFSEGDFHLDDRKSVFISSEDAKVLNSLFKDLDSKNKKEMKNIMKKDKKGYDEILKFAKGVF